MSNKSSVRIDYSKDGYIISSYKNKKLHNEEGPAYIIYDNQGEIKSKAYSIEGNVYKGTMHKTKDPRIERVKVFFQKDHIKKICVTSDNRGIEAYGISDNVCSNNCINIATKCFCGGIVNHKLDGPALVFYRNGCMYKKQYYINGYRIKKNFYKVSLLVRIAKRLFLKPLKNKYTKKLDNINIKNIAVSKDIIGLIMNNLLK